MRAGKRKITLANSFGAKFFYGQNRFFTAKKHMSLFFSPLRCIAGPGEEVQGYFRLFHRELYFDLHLHLISYTLFTISFHTSIWGILSVSHDTVFIYKYLFSAKDES